MALKVVTWNMGYWQYASRAAEACKYLTHTISSDIALVQEAGAPPEGANSVWHEIGGKRNWGSGVLTKNLRMREFEFDNSQTGAVVAAEIATFSTVPLVTVSLYAVIDRWGYAITNLHRIFSDLTPLLVGKYGKRSVIIGGDFNASRQWDEQYGGNAHNIFFQRLEDFGLVDCLAKFHSGPVQTIRHPSTSYPWQNDYIFVTKDLSRSVLSCAVITDENVLTLSDHNPVVADFNISL